MARIRSLPRVTLDGRHVGWQRSSDSFSTGTDLYGTAQRLLGAYQLAPARQWRQDCGILVDVPGAMPSNLVVALGKDGNAYLLNRSNLGGITAPIDSFQVPTSASSFRQRPPTELTRARMLLFAPAAHSSLLFALLQPIHLLSSSRHGM